MFQSIARASFFVALAFHVLILHAQDTYPSRPVKIVVPSIAGGTTDLIARALAEKVSVGLRQSVFIENKPGANGILATQSVINAVPDGHVLLLMYTAYTQNLALRSDNLYTLSDLVPLIMLGNSGTALAVPSTLPVNSVDDFIKLMRAQPGRHSYGSFGTASTAHIYGEMLKRAAALDLAHIPYKGEIAALNDVLTGQLSATWGSPGTFEPHVKAGKLKILAVTGPARMPQYPNIPTFVELGFPMFDLSGWNGMFVPKGTPAAVVARLVAEIDNALRSVEVNSKLIGFGYIPTGTKGEDFASFLNSDLKKWTEAVRSNGIRAQ